MKKISSDQIEVVNADGTHVAGKNSEETFSGFKAMNGFKMVNLGPIGGLATLVMIPILIPIAILAFFFLILISMIFGKTIFKSTVTRIIRR